EELVMQLPHEQLEEALVVGHAAVSLLSRSALARAVRRRVCRQAQRGIAQANPDGAVLARGPGPHLLAPRLERRLAELGDGPAAVVARDQGVRAAKGRPGAQAAPQGQARRQQLRPRLVGVASLAVVIDLLAQGR